jgi:DNA (cytosine-5)-methyltransferase 1
VDFFVLDLGKIMAAYYNEIDPYAAQWLRNLIEAGHIAPGFVDERSIVDVKPDELAEFTQCHFFSGIGVWSLALRRAGWPDDRPIWTGSCPCQPFSSAGKGNGFDDERHLWPHFQWLIQQRRPSVVIGEQVASKDTNPWIDLVHADLEAMGYAFGCVPFPSASVGAPHIRDRNYWVGSLGDTSVRRHPNRNMGDQASKEFAPSAPRENKGCWGYDFTDDGQSMRMAYANSTGFSADTIGEFHDTKHNPESCGSVERMDNTNSESAGWNGGATYSQKACDWASSCDGDRLGNAGDTLSCGLPGPVNGLWRSADWLHCRDGKWRPVEPGTFPLANGAASRVGRLRAYGNAINTYQAQIFIESIMEII